MIGFYISYVFLLLISILPFWLLYLLSDFLYFIVFHIVGYRKKVVFTNLKKSFPQKNEKQIKAIAKDFYKHLIDLFLESFKTLNMSEKSMKKRYKYPNIDLLEKYYRQKRNIAFITGHYANWEWGIAMPLFCEYSVLALYKPLTNKYFDNLMKKVRSKFTDKFITIPMQNSLRQIIQYSQKEQPFMVWFAGDQTPPPETPFWRQFLLQDAPIFLGAEKIAKKLDMVVAFMDIQKVKRGHYEATFNILFENPKKTTEFQITNAHTDLLETIIRKRPELWLWSHKRWKHKNNLINN